VKPVPFVLLDANVLYPYYLRDIFMHLSILGVIYAKWSEKITEEWTRSLIKNGNPKEKVENLYKILENCRDPLNRKVFQISCAELRPYLDLMETTKSVPRGRRNMAECFVDGQLIRHMIDLKLVDGSYANSVWTGKYSASRNAIMRNGQLYTSPSGFASAHYLAERPDRETISANGWKECEYQVNNDIWHSIFNL